MGHPQKRLENTDFPVIFDTLAYVKELREAGVPERQAEVQAEILSKALARLLHDNLATKQDISEVKREVLANKAEIKDEIAAVRDEISSVRKEIADAKYDLLKWFIGAIVVQAGFIVGVLKFFH